MTFNIHGMDLLNCQIKYNKRYVCGEESGKRAAWEINLLKIYEHNLMAEAGHYTYLLSDNELADLTTRQYIRAMVYTKFLSLIKHLKFQKN